MKIGELRKVVRQTAPRISKMKREDLLGLLNVRPVSVPTVPVALAEGSEPLRREPSGESGRRAQKIVKKKAVVEAPVVEAPAPEVHAPKVKKVTQPKPLPTPVIVAKPVAVKKVDPVVVKKEEVKPSNLAKGSEPLRREPSGESGRRRPASAYAVAYGKYRKEGKTHAEAVALAKTKK